MGGAACFAAPPAHASWVKLRGAQKVPRGDVACPRCGHGPRGSPGWCAACTGELDVAWVRAYGTARGRIGFLALDVRAVSRYRVAGELITEVTSTPALRSSSA